MRAGYRRDDDTAIMTLATPRQPGERGRGWSAVLPHRAQSVSLGHSECSE